MRLSDYIADKIAIILVNSASMMALLLYLMATGNYIINILLIMVAWICVLFVCFFIDYKRRNAYFERIYVMLDELDKKYVLAEVIHEAPKNEDKIYQDILRRTNKSVIEEINKLNMSQKEYKEYIECWIHDVKSPLTSIGLICENNKDEHTKKIAAELLKIEKQVENVLYYARMEHVYKDYLIHRVDLKSVVLSAIKKNKLYFIQSNVSVAVDMEEIDVSTDEKWTEFILDQILINAIKYRSNSNASVSVKTEKSDKSVSLIIEDNGIGISKKDIKRIYDKGFTGSNGRTARSEEGQGKATGLGLFLCKSLCNKLSIGIMCESEEGKYTRMILTFPEAEHTRI